MAPRLLLLGLLLGLVASGLAQKKGNKETKAPFPAMVLQARFVYVTTIYGDPFDPKIPPEDRRAASDVQDALQKWGRFTLAYRPSDADLIFVIRKGKLGSVTGGVQVPIGQPRTGTTTGTTPRTSTVFGAEAGTPGDALLIYDARTGTDAPALLKYIDEGGLDAPALQLLADFRKQVEEAAAARKKP